MARPLNLIAYETPDVADLAASYAFGIARNDPFVDGNKPTAAVVSATFLVINGYALDCTDVELVTTFLMLAAGDLTVEQLGDWFRQHIVEPVQQEMPAEHVARRASFPPQEMRWV